MSFRKVKSRNQFDGYEIFVIPKENDESVVIYKENDSMWEGPEIKGKRNGIGKLKWMEQPSFFVFGKWKNDSSTSEKYRIEFSPKKHYYGQLKPIKNTPVLWPGDFIFSGYGEFVSEGVKYYGCFKNGKKNGPGVLVHERARIKYYGYFLNNSYSGKGCLRNLKDDTLFIGNFKNGSFRGEGVIFFISSNLCVSGNFQKNGKIKNAKLSKILKKVHYTNDSIFDHSIVWDLVFGNNSFFREKDLGRDMNVLSRCRFFINAFKLSYYDQNYLNFTTDYCTTEVVSFIRHLQWFYKNSPQTKGIMKNKEDIQFHVCSKIRDAFFDYFVKKTEVKNKAFQLKMQLFDVSQFYTNFQKNYKLQFCDLTKSLQILNQLVTTSNVVEKIKIMETFRQTCILELQEIFKKNESKEIKINVDILTETFIILFHQSDIKHHIGNYTYMKTWIDFHFEEYSSRKIMSILHFYNGFINFIERLSEICDNITLIKNNIHFDVIGKILEGPGKRGEKKNKRVKTEDLPITEIKQSLKKKEENSTIHEKIIPGGFETIKNMISSSFHDDEDENVETAEGQLETKKKSLDMSNKEIEKYIEKTLTEGTFDSSMGKKILFARTLVRRKKKKNDESSESEEESDGEEEEGEEEIVEEQKKTVVTETEDLMPKMDLGGSDTTLTVKDADETEMNTDANEDLIL